MSFPLLRLPWLASIKVIKSLDIEHIVHLTQTSPKMRRLVKISKVHIELIVYPYCVRFGKIADEEQFTDLRFLARSEAGERQRKIPFKPIYISNKDWISRREEGYRKMIDDVNDVFIVEILYFNLKGASAIVSSNYLEYAVSVGLEVTGAQTMLNGAEEEVYRRLLTSCSHIPELTVHLYSAEDFRFDGFNEYTVDDFSLYIPAKNINWFTVNHMCALINCRLVLVYHINWKSEDFNRFLKFWMASDGKLQSLILFGQWSLTEDNFDVLMDGIDHIEVDFETFEIQRVDGVKAEVLCDRGVFCLDVITDEEVL